MKKKELIEQLKDVPDDANIQIWWLEGPFSDRSRWINVTEIEIAGINGIGEFDVRLRGN